MKRVLRSLGRCLLGSLMGALLALAPAAGQLYEPDLVISAGKEGGAYHAIARRLATQLTTQRGDYVEVLTSRGSMENLARLDDPDGPVGVALLQADALDAYLAEHPKLEEELILLSSVGKECVLIFAGRNGGIASAADLKSDKGHTISIDHADSGAAVTYAYMRQLEPAFRHTAPVHIDTLQALLQIREGGPRSKVKSAMIVQRPRIPSPALEAVLDDPESFRIVPLRKGDLKNSALPDGSPVYSFETVTLRGKSFETMCMRGLLLGSKRKLSDEMQTALADLLLRSRNVILPGVR